MAQIKTTSGIADVPETTPGLFGSLGYEYAIPVDKITPEKAIELPIPKQDTTDYQGIVDTGLATVNAYKPKEQTEDSKILELLSKQPEVPDLYGQYSDMYNQSGIEAKNQAIIEAQNRKNQAQSKVDVLTAQLQAITNKGITQNLALENLGALTTTDRVALSQQANLRERAIEALPLQAEAQLAQAEVLRLQGDVDTAVSVAQQAQQSLDKMFEIKSNQALAVFNYNKELYNRVWDYADKKQQNEITDRRIQEERAYNDIKDNLKLSQDLAKTATENGQGSLGAQIARLNPQDPDFQNKLAELQGQIVDVEKQLNIDIKRTQLAMEQKKLSLLGEPTPEDTKKITQDIQNVNASQQALNDKIDAIDILKSHSGLNSRVGPTWLTRKSPVTSTGLLSFPGNLIANVKNFLTTVDDKTGAGNDFAGGIHKIVSGLTLTSLIEAKKQGATFGALSDAELNTLANSASAINDWEIKDEKGKGTGVWNIDQASFQIELDNIRKITNRALLLSQQNIINNDEQYILDNAFQNQSPSNYYK